MRGELSSDRLRPYFFHRRQGKETNPWTNCESISDSSGKKPRTDFKKKWKEVVDDMVIFRPQ
jgi:hypothetical protein